MNITFLIGNGFDRAMGLDTSYNDFYKWYVKQSVENIPEHVKKFRTEIDKYVRKTPDAKAYWSDAEIGLGQYTKEFSMDTIDDFFDCHEDFREALSEYLSLQEKRIDKEKIEIAKNYF